MGRRVGPLFERKNACNAQGNGVRTKCAAIVNSLRVVHSLRVVFLVWRDPLGSGFNNANAKRGKEKPFEDRAPECPRSVSTSRTLRETLETMFGHSGAQGPLEESQALHARNRVCQGLLVPGSKKCAKHPDLSVPWSLRPRNRAAAATCGRGCCDFPAILRPTPKIASG